MSDERRRRTEDGGQRTEDGGQRTEDRRQRTEGGGDYNVERRAMKDEPWNDLGTLNDER